jgi:hypothetical protein
MKLISFVVLFKKSPTANNNADKAKNSEDDTLGN